MYGRAGRLNTKKRRFAARAEGETIIPGAGSSWQHLHRASHGDNPPSPPQGEANPHPDSPEGRAQQTGLIDPNAIPVIL